MTKILWEKLDLSCITDGSIKWSNSVGIGLTSSYKIKYASTSWPGNSTMKCLSVESACARMITTALFTMAPNWKQPKCATWGWMNYLLYSYNGYCLLYIQCIKQCYILIYLYLYRYNPIPLSNPKEQTTDTYKWT